MTLQEKENELSWAGVEGVSTGREYGNLGT